MQKHISSIFLRQNHYNSPQESRSYCYQNKRGGRRVSSDVVRLGQCQVFTIDGRPDGWRWVIFYRTIFLIIDHSPWYCRVYSTIYCREWWQSFGLIVDCIAMIWWRKSHGRVGRWLVLVVGGWYFLDSWASDFVFWGCYFVVERNWCITHTVKLLIPI